jgi:hypothetical protein
MRTTVDLPEALLKRAKIAAVERGTTLRELVGGALIRELGDPARRERPARRVRFPIVPSREPGSLSLTNADIAAAEADEDARRHGISR